MLQWLGILSVVIGLLIAFGAVRLLLQRKGESADPRA